MPLRWVMGRVVFWEEVAFLLKVDRISIRRGPWPSPSIWVTIKFFSWQMYAVPILLASF